MTTSDLIRSKKLVALATQLQRLERGADAVRADLYQQVVEQLKAELAHAEPSSALHTVLATFPGTAELYENLNYGHAGLCRSSLDAALRSELQAREVIARARRGKRA